MATEAEWAANRDYMLKQEAAGKLTDGQANWLDWYRAAGSPDTRAEFREFTGDQGVANRDYDDFAPDQEGGAYANPNQTTGTWDDGSHITLFNPVTGIYDTISTDSYEGNKYRPGKGNAIWGTVGGDAGTLIRTDVEGWEDTGAKKSVGDNYFDWTWGHSNPPSEIYIPGEGELAVGGSVVYPGQKGETIIADNGEGPDYADPGPGGGTGTGGGTDTGGVPQAPVDTEFVPYEPGMGADTSWNWDFFKPKAQGDNAWGGFDTDYGVFERYQPGQDSPWGMPDIRGGNKDFYQQQFNNLLRDEQGFRNRAKAAQLRAEENAANPADPLPLDWSWANGGEGIKDVTMGAGIGLGSPTEFALNQRYGWDNTTDNSRVLSDLSGIFSDSDNVFLNKFDDNRNWLNSGNALTQSRQSAQDFIASNPYTEDKGWTAALQNIVNNVWNPVDGGAVGPSAPPGYALPI